MELICKTVEDAILAGKLAGAKVENLSGNISVGYLPGAGTFESFGWAGVTLDADGKPEAPEAGKDNFAYLQMKTSGGGHVSVRSLSAQFADSSERSNIFVNTKEKYQLATKIHRPQFTGDLFQLAASLVGKSFKAKVAENSFVQKFVKDGCMNETDVQIVPKTFYLVDLV